MHFFTITHSQDLTDISAFSGGPFSGERELSLSFVLYYFMESFFCGNLATYEQTFYKYLWKSMRTASGFLLNQKKKLGEHP